MNGGNASDTFAGTDGGAGTGSYVPPPATASSPSASTSSADVDLIGRNSFGPTSSSNSTSQGQGQGEGEGQAATGDGLDGLAGLESGGAAAPARSSNLRSPNAHSQHQQSSQHVHWTTQSTEGLARLTSMDSDGAAAQANTGSCDVNCALPMYDGDGDGDDKSVNTRGSRISVASSFMSHLTEATDYEAMERNYRNSSVCTEAIEEHGLKDPVGFFIINSVVLISGMSRGITFPTLWLFVDSLGGTTVTMGYCIAAFSFGRVVTSPLFGHLSVDYGYRFTLFVAGAFVCLGSVLYILAQTVGRAEVIIAAQGVLGIGTGTLAVTRAYVAEVTPKGLRTTYLAYIAAVRHAGFTITPFIGSALVWYFQDEAHVIRWGPFILDMYTAPGYVLLFYNTATLIGVVFFLTHTRREIMPKLTKQVSSRIKRELSAQVPLAVSMGQEKIEMPCCSLTVINAVLVFIIFLNMISKGYTVTYETLGVKLADEIFQIDSATVGIVMGCAGVLGMTILLSFRTISKYVGDTRKITGGLIVSIVGIASLTDFGGQGGMSLLRFIVGIMCVYGVGWPMSDTAILGLYSRVLGNKPQGTLQGVLAASSALSRMLVPLMASYVSQYSSMAVFFMVINVVMVIAVALVIYHRQLLTILSTT